MLDGQRYTFTDRTDNLGRSNIMPYLPLTLTNEGRSVEVMALLDTGASVNVLPAIFDDEGTYLIISIRRFRFGRSIAFTTIDSNIITSIYLNSCLVNNVTFHQPRIARLTRSRQYRSK